MQQYAWMAIACWLVIQGLENKGLYPAALPWLWWALLAFAALAVLIGAKPALKDIWGRLRATLRLR